MSVRIKRQKKTEKIRLNNGTLLKIQLLPWIKTQYGCIWSVSMAVAKSNRQSNDWLNKRKNKRANKLNSNLTGKSGNKAQFFAIQFLHWCVDYIPPGDCLTLWCESALPDKQFRVWKKWFVTHESSKWQIEETHKSFFYYKSKGIE